MRSTVAGIATSLGIVAAGLALTAGCSIGSGTDIIYNAADEADTTSESVATTTCSSPYVAPDLSTLTACDSGRGHCYDGKKLPLIGTMDKCPGSTDVCVPDPILTAAGTTNLKTCNSVIGKPGACVSTDIAEIKAKDTQLTQDVCDANERCIPCINPLTNQPTPFCGDIGVHQDECTAGASQAVAAPQECCPTVGAAPQGLCLQGDNIPASQRGKVEQNVCPPDYSCVPSSFVNNDPVACSSTFGSGFCVDSCFTGTLGERALLQGDCPNPRDKCVPCSVGASEGLPGC